MLEFEKRVFSRPNLKVIATEYNNIQIVQLKIGLLTYRDQQHEIDTMNVKDYNTVNDGY